LFLFCSFFEIVEKTEFVDRYAAASMDQNLVSAACNQPAKADRGTKSGGPEPPASTATPLKRAHPLAPGF
jgi:hypothetical protein